MGKNCLRVTVLFQLLIPPILPPLIFSENKVFKNWCFLNYMQQEKINWMPVTDPLWVSLKLSSNKMLNLFATRLLHRCFNKTNSYNALRNFVTLSLIFMIRYCLSLVIVFWLFIYLKFSSIFLLFIWFMFLGHGWLEKESWRFKSIVCFSHWGTAKCCTFAQSKL